MKAPDTRPIVFYDGGCAVCRAFRRWIMRRDGNGRLRFEPNDEENVRRIAPWLDPAIPDRTIVLLTGGERKLTGAHAIFSIIGMTGGLLGLICRPLSLRPVSLLFEPGYRVFARNRWRTARFFHDPPEEKL